MKTQIVDLPPLSIRADVGTVNADARSVELIFSTGAAVDRMDYLTGKRYREVLSLKPADIRLDRLNAGAPLLDAHSAWSVGDVLGTVQPDSARVEKGQAIATVRFSKRDAVEPIWQDVLDGIVRSVSVGYRVHKFVEDTGGDKNAIPTRTAVDWEPFEISMVPMPADTGAKVRGDKSDTNLCVICTRDEETSMKTSEKTESQPATTEVVETRVAAPTAVAGPSEAQVRQQATEAERTRVSAIQHAVRIAKLDQAVADDMATRGITLDAARAEIFEKLAAQSDAQPPTRSQISVGEDARDKWLRGAVNWLLVKGGAAELVARHAKVDVATIDPGEFRGFTLVDLAREVLTRANRTVRGLDKMRIVSEAFMLRDITQSTSDFATLLENTMHKVLQAAYATQPDTWRRFCATSTVSDFRAHNRYRMGSFGALDTVNELGEFKHKAISDAEKATITASTKGNIITVSRQMIVNDDMGAFSRLLSMLGRAAGLSVEVDVYALLALNGGLGPTQSDSSPLFDNAARGNVTTGAAISAAALDLDRVAMAKQQDPDGNEYLDLRPVVLVTAVEIEGTAKVINAAQYDPDTTGKLQRPNIAAGLFRDIVGSPRVTTPRRYLFADPAIAPVIEVAFLEGQTSPVLETKDGWDVDGAEMKVRFDYGVKEVDYRGAITNAGQ